MKNDLLKIINNYGVNNQLRKFNEESFELIEAIFQHEEQKRVCDICCNDEHSDRELEHVIEEMADVMVILKQLQLYYDISMEDIELVMMKKIHRQLDRMEANNE